MKGCEGYSRRITWVAKGPKAIMENAVAVVEYFGTAPDKTAPYGKHTGQHKRTQQRIMVDIRAHLANKTPMEIYKMYNGADVNDAPRDLKQIRNMKYREKKQKRKRCNNCVS
jgi:hypothetical protein